MFSEMYTCTKNVEPSKQFVRTLLCFQKRIPVEPSKQFIRTYFSTFKNDPLMSLIETMKDSDDGSEPEKDRDETPEKEKAAELSKNEESPTCVRWWNFHLILILIPRQ